MSEQPKAAKPPASRELRAEIEALLEELCATHSIRKPPRLEWSTRMRRTLGRAYPGEHLIRLSAWLDATQAHDTLRHELAHIAAGVQRGAPHGRRWQEWAVRLGVEPRATARAGPSNAPQRADNRRFWGLECTGCGVRFARMRVLKGLYHRDCGPRKGKLQQVMRDQRAAVLEWITSGTSPEPSSNPASG
jgi:predicted SprT family Zn-dependent metalloprotease